MRATLLLALCVLLLGAPTARAQHGPSAPASVAAAVRERLQALVPDPPPARSTAREQPSFYGSSTLYEYMDGAADVFQAYDVQALFHREYQAGPIDVTVDIFDMGALENAFGMYAAERSPKYDFLKAGAEGYRNEGILNFFQHRYYVKLAAFGDGADAALQEFAAAISARIGGGQGFPELLSTLPEARRQPRSEKYLRTDPLGHAFLGPAYQAAYELDGGERRLMVSVGASSEDASTRLKLLEAHFRRTGQWGPAREFGDGAAQGSNSFEGSLIAATAGRYLVILLEPSAASVGFFKDAMARLR